MEVIDFHSHILPKMDDGSKDINMSIEMLKHSKKQGITTIIATPHFYAERNTIAHFFEKRARALEQLETHLDFSAPEILCGAEVRFFAGIGHVDEIEKFCIERTNLMLLEMPFRPWSEKDIYEIERLINGGITPVIAHLERFYPFQKDKDLIPALLELPVLIQLNAECLLHWKERRRAIQLFKNGKAHLLGSDCHNLTSRPQNLLEGRMVLKKKLGQEFLNRMDALGTSLLKKDIQT